MIVVARVSDHLSQSTCLEMLHPKTDEHANPSVEVHHLVGILSTDETLLRTEVQLKVPTCPGKHLLNWYTYIGKDFMLTLYIRWMDGSIDLLTVT